MNELQGVCSEMFTHQPSHRFVAAPFVADSPTNLMPGPPSYEPLTGSIFCSKCELAAPLHDGAHRSSYLHSAHVDFFAVKAPVIPPHQCPQHGIERACSG